MRPPQESPDLPGGLVGDPEFEQARLAVADHVEGLGDDRALDAAAGNGAEEVALLVDARAWLPTGRGAEPQVSTTVASATPRPACRQRCASLEDVGVGGEHGSRSFSGGGAAPGPSG